MERTGGNQQAVPEGAASSDVPPGQDPEGEEAAEETLDRPLPEGVRHRVVAIAAEAFGSLTAAELPTQLRQYARFTPTRRAKFASNALAAALESDPVFRQRIGTRLRETQAELAAALDGGTPPPAADPLDVAAAAYLLRPAGWAKLVAAAGEEAQRAHADHVGEETARELQQVREELTALRAASHDEARAARAELEAVRKESDALQRKLRSVTSDLRRGEAVQRKMENELAADPRQAAADLAAADSEARRLRARLSESEAALEAGRRAVGRAAAWRTCACGCCWTLCWTPPRGCAASWRCRRCGSVPRTAWTRSCRAPSARRTSPGGRCRRTTRRCSTSCWRCRRRISWSTATT